MHRSWLVLCLLGLTPMACLQSTREPDCILDGTCECKSAAECTAGKTCVDGRCLLLVDAGIGEVGWPCVDDAVCKRGPCLPKGPGNGNVCSAGCEADAGFVCPKGWECKQSFTGGALVCTPPLRALCLSCKSDSDCNAAGDRCVTLGASSFCGQDCLINGVCPANYTCRSLAVDGGPVARQCIPDALTCECSAVTAGLQRSCRLTNSVGTCFGFETCQANATYSGCDARAASKEVCDGIDNDCNGLTDQADPALDTSGVAGYPNCSKGLACTGKWSCQGLLDGGGSFQCSAPDPTQETCNAVDDDCNGVVDDGLLDSMNRYTSVRACGSCNTDCFVTLRDLARDGGVDAGSVLLGAAACESRSGVLTCVPKQCAKGYYPSPLAAPSVCEKAVTSQCRPCTATSDCQVPGDQCVSVGFDPGTYCAQSCDVTAPYAGCTGVVGEQGCCPADNLCEQVGASKRCVPKGNSCLCNAASAGFTRSCFRAAGTATCVGEQQCDGVGSFGQCDTSRTTLELCDGKDNDCNGLPDDPFVNTRDSGTYDSDTACGACTTNCTVRWSPTIQHAVGGCDVSGAPTCVITRCTTDTVGGGGTCRLDSDCSNGRTCHPEFRQCVRACSMSAPCGSGESCAENGFCTRGCNTDSECVNAYGPPSKCTAGTCSMTYQFLNPDLEETNGCECPTAQNVVDEPDVSKTYPVAGLPYVDRDCDGVDGEVNASIFVWAQSPSSKGTRAEPFRTITEAITFFETADSRFKTILVAQGTYVEQVVLKGGESIHGGYSSTFAERDVITFPTLIEAPEPVSAAPRGTVNVHDTLERTVLSGFTIRGYDVISRTGPGQQARSSFAVYVKNAPSFMLLNSHVIGGRGGDAVPAQNGVAGTNGINGQNGLSARECDSVDCANEAQPGGQAGSNAVCPGETTGNLGAGSTLANDPQDYQSGSNGNGRGGGNGRYTQSDPTQFAFCKYDCIVPSEGLNGGAAQNGSDGVASIAGNGCADPSGFLSADDWLTPAGSVGGDGTVGRGGGGGGAGGCVFNSTPGTCTIGRHVGDLGATGGGGGAGGCGGGRGFGAGGGGASFAIFTTGPSPSLDGNLIDLGFGGAGGKGGEGGYGGLGGQGGRGGEVNSAAWCAGPGGAGGRGGNGGAGTGGGGGCGGSVFGIGGVSIAGAGFEMRNTLATPPLNASGAGGVGGASPTGPVGKGGDGAKGAVVLIQSF